MPLKVYLFFKNHSNLRFTILYKTFTNTQNLVKLKKGRYNVIWIENDGLVSFLYLEAFKKIQKRFNGILQETNFSKNPKKNCKS